MKKTLSTAALSTVLVLGMAAGAMATHLTQADQTAVSSAGAAKITLDGSIRERGRIDKKTTAKDSAASQYYDSRVRLGVKAQVSDQVTGYVQLVSATNQTDDTISWGKGSAAGLHNGGYMSGGMDITQAWINYNAGSWGVKVGHQPLALGNKVFFDHTGYGDDAIMAYTSIGATHLAGILIKFDEQNLNDSTDDLDGYVLMATQKFSDNLDAGINWTYLRGGSSGTELAGGMSLSNVGINANYRQDSLSFMADGEFQFGTVSDNGTNKAKAKGFAVKLAANIDLGAAKVGLLYGYGSGDGNAGPGSGGDDDNFYNFLSDTNYDTIIAGYRAAIPGNGLGTAHSGLNNLSEYQINASTKTTCPITGKPLSLMTSATYLQLNKKSAATANGYLGTDDSVGTEVDAIASWTLAPGLIYKVEAAYLFTGDAWKTSVTGPGNDPDNLYFLRHRLEFTF